MKNRLLNNVHRSQIGYYRDGIWKPKISFNFKLHTYISDNTQSIKGWVGIIRADEAPDEPLEIFFPSTSLETYKKCREHVRESFRTPVVLAGGPESKKEWALFIEGYVSDLGKKTPIQVQHFRTCNLCIL